MNTSAKRRSSRAARQAGFTLLLAALIASIVLTIASAIFDIAQKQITLSSLSQQSQYAFYAADTAAECALYWDVRLRYFAAVTPPGVTPMCDGTTLAITPTYLAPAPPATYPYTMSFNLSLQNGNCAAVSVEKCQGTISYNGTCSSGAGASIATQIRANGFNNNTPCIQSGTVSPTTLERSVELNY